MDTKISLQIVRVFQKAGSVEDWCWCCFFLRSRRVYHFKILPSIDWLCIGKRKQGFWYVEERSC